MTWSEQNRVKIDGSIEVNRLSHKELQLKVTQDFQRGDTCVIQHIEFNIEQNLPDSLSLSSTG